jgi:hypothetical protein
MCGQTDLKGSRGVLWRAKRARMRLGARIGAEAWPKRLQPLHVPWCVHVVARHRTSHPRNIPCCVMLPRAVVSAS